MSVLLTPRQPKLLTLLLLQTASLVVSFEISRYQTPISSPPQRSDTLSLMRPRLRPFAIGLSLPGNEDMREAPTNTQFILQLILRRLQQHSKPPESPPAPATPSSPSPTIPVQVGSQTPRTPVPPCVSCSSSSSPASDSSPSTSSSSSSSKDNYHLPPLLLSKPPAPSDNWSHVQSPSIPSLSSSSSPLCPPSPSSSSSSSLCPPSPSSSSSSSSSSAPVQSHSSSSSFANVPAEPPKTPDDDPFDYSFYTDLYPTLEEESEDADDFDNSVSSLRDPVNACPAEESRHFCLNGGRCVFMSIMEDKFCICPKGFQGRRCQASDPHANDAEALEEVDILKRSLRPFQRWQRRR